MNINLLVNKLPKQKVIKAINKILKNENLELSNYSLESLWKIFSSYSNYKITKFSFNQERKVFYIEYITNNKTNELNLYVLKTISPKNKLNLNDLFHIENAKDLEKITNELKVSNEK